MKSAISDTEYRALAELRYRIRHFIQEGDAAAQRSNLEPQQYLMLLAIRGLPQGAVATISTLAERMALKHHSAVELINRLESHGLVRRSRSEGDKREVRVSLLPRGSKLLDRVARERLSELKASGTALVNAITALVQHRHPSQRIPQPLRDQRGTTSTRTTAPHNVAKTKQQTYAAWEKKECLRIHPGRRTPRLSCGTRP